MAGFQALGALPGGLIVAVSAGLGCLAVALLAVREVRRARARARAGETAAASAVARLEDTRRFLGELLGAMADALLVIGPDGTVRRTNRAAADLLGLDSHALPGTACGALAEDALDAEDLARRFAEGSVPPSERRLKTPEGQAIPVLLSSAVVEDDRGQPVLVCVARDLRLRMAAEEERRRALEVQRRAASMRTLLDAIVGYGELLVEEDRPGVPLEVRADLLRIAAAGRQLLGLVDGVLDVPGPAHGGELRLEDLDVGEVIREVVETVRPLLGASHARLRVRLPPAPGRVRADRSRLRQVLLALLAQDADPGEVILEVEADGREVVFHVRDAGSGVDAERLARLGHPVEQMGGTIAVRTVAGEGRCFTVRVAAAARDGAGAEERYVIVVDDDPGARRILTRGLERRGWRVLSAEDGRQALALVRSVPARAILLDLELPDMDGFALAEALGAEPAAREVPIIVLTGHRLGREEITRLGRTTRSVIYKGRNGLGEIVAELGRVDAA